MIKIFNRKKKEEIDPEEILQQTREKTTQQWMPIKDIDGKVVYRKDDILVGAIRVYPVNLSLLSNNESRSRIGQLAEEKNGITDDFELFVIGRPVDLTALLEAQHEKAKTEENFIKKQVLRGYIREASEIAASGEITEKRYYYIITQKNQGNKPEEDLIFKLEEFKTNLTNAGLTAVICQEDEIMDVYSLFASPVQAAFEKNEIHFDLPTLFE